MKGLIDSLNEGFDERIKSGYTITTFEEMYNNIQPFHIVEPLQMIVGYDTGKLLAANGVDMSRVTVVGGWYNKKTKKVERRWFNNIDYRTVNERKTQNLVKRLKNKQKRYEYNAHRKNV